VPVGILTIAMLLVAVAAAAAILAGVWMFVAAHGAQPLGTRADATPSIPAMAPLPVTPTSAGVAPGGVVTPTIAGQSSATAAPATLTSSSSPTPTSVETTATPLAPTAPVATSVAIDVVSVPTAIATATSTQAETTPAVVTVVVAPGDTLASIAARFGVTVADIAALNTLDDPDLIYPGQQLLIPIAASAP
jgi:LysM repeat protein